MKKGILFMAMMVASSIIFAQSQRSDSNAGKGKHADRLKKELSLSEDQASKMKAIRSKYAGEYTRIHRDTALTQGSARNQQKQLMVKQEAEVKGVLTPEQWTKYTAMKTRHADQRKKYHRGKNDRGSKG